MTTTFVLEAIDKDLRRLSAVFAAQSTHSYAAFAAAWRDLAMPLVLHAMPSILYAQHHTHAVFDGCIKLAVISDDHAVSVRYKPVGSSGD